MRRRKGRRKKRRMVRRRKHETADKDCWKTKRQEKLVKADEREEGGRER